LYRQNLQRATAITDEIEIVLIKLRLAQLKNQPAEVNAFTNTLEKLLGQYMELRQGCKLPSVI